MSVQPLTADGGGLATSRPQAANTTGKTKLHELHKHIALHILLPIDVLRHLVSQQPFGLYTASEEQLLLKATNLNKDGNTIIKGL